MKPHEIALIAGGLALAATVASAMPAKALGSDWYSINMAGEAYSYIDVNSIKQPNAQTRTFWLKRVLVSTKMRASGYAYSLTQFRISCTGDTIATQAYYIYDKAGQVAGSKVNAFAVDTPIVPDSEATLMQEFACAPDISKVEAEPYFGHVTSPDMLQFSYDYYKKYGPHNKKAKCDSLTCFLEN